MGHDSSTTSDPCVLDEGAEFMSFTINIGLISEGLGVFLTGEDVVKLIVKRCISGSTKEWVNFRNRAGLRSG